jgi:hypothetical protein
MKLADDSAGTINAMLQRMIALSATLTRASSLPWGEDDLSMCDLVARSKLSGGALEPAITLQRGASNIDSRSLSITVLEVA